MKKFSELSSDQFNASTFYEAVRKRVSLDINCHRVGTIQEIVGNELVVNIADKTLLVDGTEGVLPQLVGVPFLMFSNAQGGLHYPINVGDECLLCFNDRDIDNFLSGVQLSVPNSHRVHSMSDAIAVVGMHSQSQTLTNYSNQQTKLFYGSSEITLSDKIVVKNGSESLKSILTELVTTIKALQTIDSQGHAGAISNQNVLDPIITKINNLLND